MAITKIREETIGPIVVLSQQQIAELYALLKDFTSAGDEATGAEVSSPDVYVKMTNTDELKLGEIDDIHTVTNRSNNLIKGVRLVGLGRDARLAQVSFENRQTRSAGFLMLSGPPDEVDKFLSGVKDVVGNEKPLRYFFATVRPAIVTLLAVLAGNYISGILNTFFETLAELDLSAAINFTLGYLMVFVALPFLVLIQIFERIQHRFLGRFVADWGDGAIRFERALTITNYALFSVPIAIALKLGLDLLL